ncbi:GMC family oxidoreductase [candidate division KSB1 bacterium]|nr:GMC family oxidoreductase [candidate division KSB1 bacterium]
MKTAIVVGSGAAGATVGRALQGKFDVTVLEAGKPFRPFPYSIEWLQKFRKTGLFFDEREIQWLFPTMQIRKTAEKMVLVNGIGTGGTTTIATGNALFVDRDFKKLGIDLGAEFDEIISEIPVSTAHQKHWRKITRQLFEACEELNLNPQPMPKMGNYENCKHCGRCVFGCPLGVKWDSRQFLQDAVNQGTKLETGSRVDQIVLENGIAKGVVARTRFRSKFFPADLIVLAAGGFGTPVILQNSGIECESQLFVDPVLCVATEWRDAVQHREVEMPFFAQQDHFMLSPYFDYLSFFFNKNWRQPARHILSLMIKLADSNRGGISGKKIDKTLTEADKAHLQQGVERCREIFGKLGIRKETLFLGTLNAGHPGGMFPLTENEAQTFHHSALPENLYLADATLIPQSLGNPPTLTIIAIAKRVSRLIKDVG